MLHNNILKDLATNLQHPIIITKTCISDSHNPVDLGREISLFISKLTASSKTPLRVKDYIDDLIGKMDNPIIIKNIGILFEPDLKFNVTQVLISWAKSKALVVEWEGEIENKNLYFLSKQRGRLIDLSQIGFEYYQQYEI